MAKKKKSGNNKPGNHKPGTEVELEEMNILLQIPTEAVSLGVITQLLDGNGKLMKVSTTLSASEIREKRQAFLDNVEFGDDYDGKFVITEEGRRYLEELERKQEVMPV